MELNIHVKESLNFDFFAELRILLDSLKEKKLNYNDQILRAEVLKKTDEMFGKYPWELLPKNRENNSKLDPNINILTPKKSKVF